MNGRMKLFALMLALVLALGSLGALAEAADTVADTGADTAAADTGAAADNAEAAEPEPPIAEGTGWTLASTGWLTVGPEARLSYGNRADVEWYAYMDRIFGVDVQAGVEELGPYVFCDAVNLRWVKLPDGLKRIGLRSFSHCERLQALALPESVESIDYWAFAGCYELEQIVARGMDQVDNYNFQNCQGLLRAVIGEPVTRLGYDTLEDCAAMRELYLPASLTRIDTYALRGCDALSDIYFAGSEAQWQAIRVEDGNADVIARATVHFDTPWDAAVASPMSALRPDYPLEDWIRLWGSLQLNYSAREYHGYINKNLGDRNDHVAEIGVDGPTLERFMTDHYVECAMLPRGGSYDDAPCYMLVKCGETDFAADETLARLRQEQPEVAAEHLAFLEERVLRDDLEMDSEPTFEAYGGMEFAVYRGREEDVYMTVLDGCSFVLVFNWEDGDEREARSMEEDIMSNLAHYTPEDVAPEETEAPEAPAGREYSLMGGKLALTLDPAVYDVILQDNSDNGEVAEHQGLPAEKLDLYMQMVGFQMMAVPAGTPFLDADWRFILHVKDPAYMGMRNMKELDDADERALCQTIAAGFGITDWRLVEADDVDYMVFEALGSVRYATIVNQRMIYFYIKSENGPVTDAQRQMLDEIMQGVKWGL